MLRLNNLHAGTGAEPAAIQNDDPALFAVSFASASLDQAITPCRGDEHPRVRENTDKVSSLQLTPDDKLPAQ